MPGYFLRQGHSDLKSGCAPAPTNHSRPLAGPLHTMLKNSRAEPDPECAHCQWSPGLTSTDRLSCLARRSNKTCLAECRQGCRSQRDRKPPGPSIAKRCVPFGMLQTSPHRPVPQRPTRLSRPSQGRSALPPIGASSFSQRLPFPYPFTPSPWTHPAPPTLVGTSTFPSCTSATATTLLKNEVSNRDPGRHYIVPGAMR